MGIFLRAAESSLGKEGVGTARMAVGEFQTIVKTDLGGWDMLDMAISSWLPEARVKAELVSGRQVYSGLCSMFGVTAAVQLATAVLHPDAAGQNCDVAIVGGSLGLRRLRPGKEVPIESLGPRPGEPDPSSSVESLSDAQNPDDLPLLKPFCSSPLPPFRVITTGHLRDFVMSGDGFGVRSAVDLCLGIVSRSVRPLYQPESGPRIRVAASATISVPVKKLVFNVLLDDDMYRGCEPELILYRTHERGPASPNDPGRDIDRMESAASIQYLGRGPHCFHVTEFARHVELVQYVCDRMGWDINRLRGYRCRVQYPFPIAQYSIVFEPPSRETNA
ncbi:MAG: hypothetical protein JXB13_19380 [Phycisphaerae bacterium]|nr:hypothetical protein [Phycisphaerae bacterium]